MKRLNLLIVGIFSFVLACCAPALAQGSPWAMSATAGTLGVGGEGICRFTPHLNGRIGAHTFPYDTSGTEGDIKYDFELELLNFSALVDWFPSENCPWRLTGGLIVNENSIDASAHSTASYTIGNTTYSASEVGSLTGDMGFNKVGPYVGLGFGNPFGDQSRWSFSLDLGVFYQGTPDVNLNANGTLASDASFLADLAREEEDLKNMVEDYKFYPVVSFGIAYRF